MKKLTMLWMFTLVFLLTTAVFNISSTFAQEPESHIVGKWMNDDESSVVKISLEADGTYSGTLVWLRDGDEVLDANNPDEAQKGRNLVGTTILTGFSYDSAENVWSGGKIYDYQSGNSYDCKMWIEQSETLSVRGFMGLSIIGRTSSWTVFTPNMEAYLSR